MSREANPSMSPIKRALRAVEDMQAKLEAVEYAKKEPIAIVGMSCRFPGGVNSPDSYWQLLQDGVDGISEVPSNRWDMDAFYDPNPDVPGKICSRYGGFVSGIEDFDAQFFGISPREAISLDPQQRLLLEVSWEAWENAGISPEKLAGSQTGVFIGICASDYLQRLLTRDATEIDAYQATGNAHSVAAGRLSYSLGLTGPSLVVDTACSSSLVAVHLACQSLRNRECNLALAGGVSLLMSPESSINFSKARMLSPDGRCKTFDASANGYVRGEGCGTIILKRLTDAIADHDPILALIRGSAINQDGRSSGLTVPNGPSQQAVIRQALTNGGVAASQVNYIEAHGTGTSLGDPIEVGALAEVFGKNRPPDEPLVIGSVKTNIGHLEAAAGIAGLIKVVLQLQHQEIAPHLHFETPSLHINWDDLPLIVPTHNRLGQLKKRLNFAGVSSFGFSGTNAHVVLAETPSHLLKSKDAIKQKETSERPYHLLTLSAKTPAALQQLVSNYQNYVQTHSDLPLADICFTANVGRSHFQHRLTVLAASNTELIEKLARSDVYQGQLPDTSPPKVTFLFTGQGSQYPGMGYQLYQTQPTFRQTLERCDQILQPYLDKSLIEVLYPPETPENISPSHLLDQTAYTQPALFALEYSLYQLWKSWGITPAVVMGHSVGEYVAACVAGVFNLDDGLKLVAERGRLMQALPSTGAMVAVIADQTMVTQAIAHFPGQISIAAINGRQHFTLSGQQEAVQQVVTTLTAQGAKTTPLPVSHAFHSPLMTPMLTEFEQIACSIHYSKPGIKVVSNVTGDFATPEIATPHYWVNHVRESVKFATSMETLHQQGYEIFVEIGPKPILLSMGRQCLPDGVGLWLPSLRVGQPEWRSQLESLAQLYVRGVPVDWSGFDRDYSRHKVLLPTYPFQRQRYWIDNVRQSPNQIGGQVKPLMSEMEVPVASIDSQSPNTIEEPPPISIREMEVSVASLDSRKSLVAAFIKEQAAQALGLKPSQLSESKPLNHLGFDSLMALELRNRIAAKLGVDIPMVNFLEAPTVETLTTQVLNQLPTANHLFRQLLDNNLIDGEPRLKLASELVQLQPQGTKPPFFCIHPLAGVTFPYYELATLLDQERPFYAFQSVGLLTNEKPLTSVEEMAARYIQALQEVQPSGPYYLGGWSLGAFVAWEMAVQLTQAGEEVAFLGVIDFVPGLASKIANFIFLCKFIFTQGLFFIWPYVSDFFGLRSSTETLKQPESENYLFFNLGSIVIVVLQAFRKFWYRLPAAIRLLRIVQANSKAVSHYVPPVYSGEMTLLRTNKPLGSSFDDQTLGWKELAKAGVEVHFLPGNHLNLLRQPHVLNLAEKLKNCLDKAQV